MPQPTFAELFGTGSTFNAVDSRIEIPLSALIASGLSATAPTALEALAAIVKTAHPWLNTNTDEAVMAASTKNTFAPSTRNNELKTQHGYTLDFYGSYTEPTLDPDEV